MSINKDEHKNIDSLIEGLSGDLQCCKPLSCPFKRIAPWAILSAAYMAFIVFFIGIRDDLIDKSQDVLFLFEISLASVISITAAIASSFMCSPDMCERKWIPTVSITSAAIFLLWTIVRYSVEGIAYEDIHWDHCLEGGALIGILPAIALVLLIKKGKTTAPVMMVAMNTLAVSGLAYIAMRFACAVDTVGHSGIVQITPFIVSGLILGLLARKLYRW